MFWLPKQTICATFWKTPSSVVDGMMRSKQGGTCSTQQNQYARPVAYLFNAAAQYKREKTDRRNERQRKPAGTKTPQAPAQERTSPATQNAPQLITNGRETADDRCPPTGRNLFEPEKRVRVDGEIEFPRTVYMFHAEHLAGVAPAVS